VFPAAAFVDIVLEAGVQLFERPPLRIEDLKFASRSSCRTRVGRDD